MFVPWLAPHQLLMTAGIQQKLGRSHHVCSLAGSSPAADDSWYTTIAGEEPGNKTMWLHTGNFMRGR